MKLQWRCITSRPGWSQGADDTPNVGAPSISKLRLTVSIVGHYPKTQQGTPNICLHVSALAVGVHTERRDMADGWLLKGVEELVNKVKLLESEKREVVAKIEVLERENCELTAIIAQASAVVAQALKEGTTADIS
jgi:hypothetical protein